MAISAAHEQAWLTCGFASLLTLAFLANLLLAEWECDPVPPFVTAFLMLGAVGSATAVWGLDGAVWLFPAILGLALTVPATWRWAWLLSGILMMTVLFETQPSLANGSQFLLALVVFALILEVVLRANVITRDKLLGLVVRDPLTGVFNKRQLDFDLELAVERVRRNCQPCTLIAIDLDHFKPINDRHGHAHGDQTLLDVATALQRRLRRVDRTYRRGGDEFVVLLENTPLAGGCLVAESLRTIINQLEGPSGGRMTASLGVAEFREGQSATEWLHDADSRMYRAKVAGRNRVVADGAT
jgi:diguanylate cyclase (GGDEF)-like protein